MSGRSAPTVLDDAELDGFSGSGMGAGSSGSVSGVLDALGSGNSQGFSSPFDYERDPGAGRYREYPRELQQRRPKPKSKQGGETLEQQPGLRSTRRHRQRDFRSPSAIESSP